MRVLITNTVALNGGEAATIRAIVKLLRGVFGQATEIVVYEQQPVIARRYYPDLVFRRLLWYRVSHEPAIRFVGRMIGGLNRARFMWAARLWKQGRKALARLVLTKEEKRDIETYERADLVVSTGGTYLVENYDLRPRIFDYRFCLLLDRPLVFFTQSLGPFNDPWNRTALREVFDRARLVLLRDEESLRNLVHLGVENPDIHVTADGAFALGDGAATARGARGAVGGPGARRLSVVVSVRYWRFFEHETPEEGMARYRSLVAVAVSHLVRKHDADVTFLSTCQGIREYWADDSRIAEEIARTLDPDVRAHVRVDADFHDPEAMIGLLRGHDFVVATRFHMAVLALLAGTPTLAISYEFKTRELFDRLGLGTWQQDIEIRDANAFCGAVDRCIAERSAVQEKIARGVAAERNRALASGELLRRALATSVRGGAEGS